MKVHVPLLGGPADGQVLLLDPERTYAVQWPKPWDHLTEPPRPAQEEYRLQQVYTEADHWVTWAGIHTSWYVMGQLHVAGAEAHILRAIMLAWRAKWARTMCKHCGVRIVERGDGGGHYYCHADGPNQGMVRCAIEPYGFQAEPEGAKCNDQQPNPCMGSLWPASRQHSPSAGASVCGDRGGFLGAPADVCQMSPDHGGAVHRGAYLTWDAR